MQPATARVYLNSIPPKTRNLGSPTCSFCDGSGWRLVLCRGDLFAKMCDCRRPSPNDFKSQAAGDR